MEQPERPEPASPLDSLLAGRTPIIEIAPDCPGVTTALLDRTRRLLVPVQGRTGPPSRLAIRPDDGCRECNGSTSYRVRGATRERACRCIERRIRQWVEAREPVSGPSPILPPVAVADVVLPVREGRVEELQWRIATGEARMAEALAEVELRIQPVRELLDTAERRVRVTDDACAWERANASGARSRAAELRRQAAEADREADAHDAEAVHIAGGELADAITASLDAQSIAMQLNTERAKVERHHQQRLDPVRASLARLLRRRGPGGATEETPK